MKIIVRELTTVGPTLHSAFEKLPFHREPYNRTSLPRPILAYQSPSCIKIVGNIHHFVEARESGAATVPVYLIQESESTLELLALIVAYYAPMNLLDKALFTRAALDLGVPRNLLIQQLFPLMDLPPREKLVDQVLFLLKLPVHLQHFIVDKGISLKRALIFQRAADHLDWVDRFVGTLNIGINMTTEIIQNIWEISRRDDLDFKTTAQNMGLWDLPEAEIEDSRLAVMTIREKINAARYPHLTAADKRLQAELQSADLPPAVKVTWDPHFEEQGLDIRLHARDKAELEQILAKLNTPGFKKLFESI